MVVPVKSEFVATLQTRMHQALKVRGMIDAVMLVKVRDDQPSDSYFAQRINSFDEGLIVCPCLRRNIMQYQ